MKACVESSPLLLGVVSRICWRASTRGRKSPCCSC
jgi:hypothetical protein